MADEFLEKMSIVIIFIIICNRYINMFMISCSSVNADNTKRVNVYISMTIIITSLSYFCYLLLMLLILKKQLLQLL